MNIRLPSLALLLSALASGCGSPPTVEDRIAADPDRFQAYPLDTQEKIRQGQIEIGFTPEMVRFAAGEPDGVSTFARREEPKRTIWIYRGYAYHRQRVHYGDHGYGFHHFHSSLRHNSHHGCYSHHAFGYPVWVDVRVPHDRLRVDFEAGRVAAIARHDR